MAVRPVLRMGDPLLWQQALPIEQFDTPELHTLIKDMEDTMAHLSGAGLAAPQIGVSQRLVIFGNKDETVKNPRYPDADAVPYTVLINPVIVPIGEEMEDGWEGCLSVPDMLGVVPRYQSIYYSGVDQYGNRIDRSVEGFHARVVQHECDHLDGVLYPMRISDFKQFGFKDALFPDLDIHDT
ncbi:MAG: peptide deformylase [Methylophilaceae bacterium]